MMMRSSNGLYSVAYIDTPSQSNAHVKIDLSTTVRYTQWTSIGNE
jgi:hypothetical protein